MPDENIRQMKSYGGRKHMTEEIMTDENIWQTKTYDRRKYKTDEII